MPAAKMRGREMQHVRRDRFISIALLFLLLLCVAPCFAHPMGNFSINHYAKIKIGDHSVEILYLVDMAEIPTYQEIRQSNLDPKEDERSADQYLARQEQLLGKGLTVEIDGQAVVLRGI